MDVTNIAIRLDSIAKQIPNTPAVIVPHKNQSLSFKALSEESNRIASGLLNSGFQTGERVLLMVPPGIEFSAITFALFKIGVLPVLIDPGLGKDNILKGIAETKPEALIGIPRAHVARIIYREAFRRTHRFVTVGTRWFWGGETFQEIRKEGVINFSPVEMEPGDPAAVLFTSGSTGPAKGVVYTHAMFEAQVQILEIDYGFQPGEVDLATFPLFALFSTALGMTCVIPDMNPTQPANVNPMSIIGPIKQYQIANSFGSPALWDTVSRYCLDQNIKLPTLRRILMAGAPVTGSLLQRFEKILEPGGKIFTPYGATEALPVASIERRTILNVTWSQTEQGKGVCVGKPVTGIKIKIIELTDEPIAQWSEELETTVGEIGEIVVQGPWVTREYFKKKQATTLAKIKDGDRFWHRMGDVGYLDMEGKLWFCGRKSQRVLCQDKTLFTIPCEAIFNKYPDVKRSALVGIGPKGKQIPIIVIEARPGKNPESDLEDHQFKEELLRRAAACPLTKDIHHILFHPSFPVDVRHNSKISREKLAVWAEEKLESKN